VRNQGKHAHLSADVWGIVRVAQLSGDVEAELLAVLHSGITQPGAQGATLHTAWSRKRERRDYAFRRQFNWKPSIIPGCLVHMVNLEQQFLTGHATD